MIKLRIKECCKEHGITLKELAERLGMAQASTLTQAIARNKFGIDRLAEMAKIIGCEEVELFADYQAKGNMNFSDSEICAFVRFRGIHYTADNLDEFNNIVEEIKNISK